MVFVVSVDFVWKIRSLTSKDSRFRGNDRVVKIGMISHTNSISMPSLDCCALLAMMVGGLSSIDVILNKKWRQPYPIF
jgi:hypothetical protein